MSGLKQELGLAQGIGLLSTSLLGTGVFAVPALAALVAGNNSLWAWPVLIILVFPIAPLRPVTTTESSAAEGGATKHHIPVPGTPERKRNDAATVSATS